jgi:hypothetical protein
MLWQRPSRRLLDHAATWKTTSTLTQELWSPPSDGSFKVNFDTAIQKQFSMQAAVCRDSKGHIIKALSLISPPCDAIMVKPLLLSWQLHWQFLWTSKPSP